ncbi:preprotein translocase subunit SecA [Bradyrhizobium tropiciagri]|uniref:preprotein translocase subunit SecA n=1 Tax=Bradyrhizobium tropiciagri TaxID=312253 RepID=UPI001BA9464A|nr:preprotein translocase subunit SecA [Bradyrhizobium tropiciagri]MBR0874892.1 preprotein translocase subunit SecA [Bradyrhizobium tropiciagri]
MSLSLRPRQINGFCPVSADAPYAERPTFKEGSLDAALLGAWGRISPQLLPALSRSRLWRFARQVEELEPQLVTLTDRRLRDFVDEWRPRMLSARLYSQEMATSFALAREAARRHVGMRHFPVQLLGGAAMMSGALAEMETGEGKTLTALLPAITAVLMGRPVHIITVNDYLARRDAEQLAPVYNALGLTVGLVEHGQQAQERQRAYASDVTYCTNKELVFDYLRDRLALGPRRARARLSVDDIFNSRLVGHRQPLLRGLHFALVDEADSVLIDEARVPLILAGSQEGTENADGLYETALDIARRLTPGEEFTLRANEKSIRLNARGNARIALLAAGLPGLWAIRRAREEIVQNALAALHLYRRDVQYIVADGKVQIVDEYTGRVMPDRSWESGIHQLIEAKEHCTITERRNTLAQITYQRFFRRYVHLCGMTGTATEPAGELYGTYGLRVVRIPTNKPLRRTNSGTRVLRTAELKWNAVVESASDMVRAGRAVLVGTRSVEASEHIAELLRRSQLEPVVLNARQDRTEAQIVELAGQPGRITVATNMAGRGTDIQLHPAVREAGGLHVILTEYHESRRIDRQLFGRAGRQGDPGSYESVVALDDELFRRFVNGPLLRLVGKGSKSDQPLPALSGRTLRGYSQHAAERLHSRARRAALAEDLRVNKILGFAGTE